MAAKPGATVKGVSVAQMVQAAQKEMGDDIGQIGGEYADVDRIPTGMLEFDVATGGGFPLVKVSIVYGNESASKTVHAMLAIASHQRMFPELTCAYIALEGYSKTDKAWFKMLGVDVEKLAVFQPTTAEQVVDIMDSFCWANDAGLIVLDSIAAMMTATEFENSADKKTMGGAGIPISVMVRKTTAALNKSPSRPTIIYINQVRTKIGVMYGDPTTMPGGNGIKFQAAMIIKLYGKNELDTKVNKAMPVRKAVTAVIQKWKVPIIAVKAEYEAVMIAHNGLRVGQTDWFNTFKAYGLALNMIEPVPKTEDRGFGKGKGYTCFQQTWRTYADMEKELYEDAEIATAIIADLIAALASDGKLIEAMEGGEEDA